MVNSIYISLLALLFGASPFVIYLIRPDFNYSLSTAVLGSFFGLYCVAPLALWQKFFCKRDPRSIFVEPVIPYFVVVFNALVLYALAELNPEDLEISRNSARLISRSDLFLINLNLIASLMALVYLFYKFSSFGLFIFVISTAVSAYISYLEGRRAIVAIILGSLVLCYIAFAKGGVTAKVVNSAFFSVILFAAFLFITAIRVDAEVFDVQLLAKLALTRVFNPGWMINEVISNAHVNYDSLIFSNILERLSFIFGLTSEYSGAGNRFGVAFGFIDKSNTVVGINPGIVVEAYLLNPIFAPLLVSGLCIWGSIVVRIFQKFSKALSVLVILLIIHGMQMEVGYTVGLLVRLSLLGLSLVAISRLLPRRKSSYVG